MSNPAPIRSNVPLQYFNSSTGRWESSPSSAQNAPATTTPTPAPPVVGMDPKWNTTDIKAEQLNLLASKYNLPPTPTGYAVSSFEETSAGLSIQYRLADPLRALEAGTWKPKPRELNAVLAQQYLPVRQAKASAFWGQYGHADWGMLYDIPNVPSGYKIGKVEDVGGKPQVWFTEINPPAYSPPVGWSVKSSKVVGDQIEYSLELTDPMKALGAGTWTPKGRELNAYLAGQHGSKFWTKQGYPDLADKYYAVSIPSGFKISKVEDVGGKLEVQFAGGGGAGATTRTAADLVAERASLIYYNVKGLPQFAGKFEWPKTPAGYEIASVADVGGAPRFTYSLVNAEKALAAGTLTGKNLNTYLTSKRNVFGTALMNAVLIKEPHGVNVGGSQIYAVPNEPATIHLEAGPLTGYSEMGVRGQTRDTKSMDYDPFVKTSLTGYSEMGISGQTRDTKSMDVIGVKPEVTTGILQALQTSRADILRGQGLELPPKTLAETLAEKGVVGEAVGGFISPVENLMLLGGKALRIPIMEQVKYNPTAFGIPVQAASSFFTGALTGKPIERASVNAQAQFLKEHPVYAGASVAGDIFFGWLTGKVVSGVGGKVGGKVSSLYENLRYGKIGSEKFLSSIEKGTIVNPETGVTSYTGFAAKQASRLGTQISSLPFGTEKSLSKILSAIDEDTGALVASDETATAALGFQWDLGLTPKTTMFSISKLADPLYMRPSLPIYQMIGGSLVNISELTKPWTESEKFEFTKPETTIKQTSIQTDFAQLGFKDVITPKEAPFNVQGFKDMPVGYSGSPTQHLYMKASNVFSEVKNILADTGSAYRLELVLNKPSTSFMETSVQGISAGMSLPSARLVGTKAISESVLLPLLGSYRGTAAEKEYVKAQNEMYGKNEASSRITINTKLSSEFAFPTSIGAFPVIPEVLMSRQGQRLETKQADVEEYVSVSTKLFQSQAGESAYKTPTLQIPQLTRLKLREGSTYMPKIADYLGAREREGLIPFVISDMASVLVTAQTPSVVTAQVPVTVTRLDIPTPNLPVIIPPGFGRLSIGGGGGGAGGFGFKRFGGVFRKWPVRLPKDVFAMSVKQMRVGMTYGSRVHPAMRGIQKGPTIRQPRRRSKRGSGRRR